MTSRALCFKWASEPLEFEQIHQLNYRTFVEEIPQHASTSGGSLVDAFHHENRYAICLRDRRLLGMVTYRGVRPFSLDKKLKDLDSYLPGGRRICEIRLLAIERQYRHGIILRGLLKLLTDGAQSEGYDLAIISGILSQRRLYEHLGFVPFGSEVGTPPARFQPMMLTLESFRDHAPAVFSISPKSPEELCSFLPGPVNISPAIQEAFRRAPVSHRSSEFLRDWSQVEDRLCQLTRAHGVTLLAGSGTLANEAIAAQMSLMPGRGLILVTGEFGARLVDHAKRWSLRFDVLEKPWGSVVDADEVEKKCQEHPDLQWVWAVHCETSTGVLQDLAILKHLCSRQGAKLVIDAISSIGTVPVDLRGIYLASGVSGKGLGSYAGLAMVYADHEILPSACIPRYLDVGFYRQCSGIPFTVNSNLFYALQAALNQFPSGHRMAQTRSMAATVRESLERQGFRMMAPAEYASPCVLSFVPPEGIRASMIGRRLKRSGFQIAYESHYLQERNALQICLMGDISERQVNSMRSVLESLVLRENNIRQRILV